MHLPLSFNRLLGIWAVMAVAMTINGIGRETLLKRFVSTDIAAVTSILTGMTLIAIVTGVGFRAMARPSPLRQLVLVSVIMVLMTVVFETLLGRYLDGKSWKAILDHYAFWHGELWPVGLLWLACMPFLWGSASAARS